ncbi:MAG: ATP-binding cassette domain-containing protein, partial [Pseudomonadota bacterium]
MTAALELSDVHKSFGKAEIIRGVDLDVAPGERHAIIGPNGAGKSTLFNLITGRFSQTSGTIRLHGQDLAGMAPYQINRMGLSRSFQITNIFPKMTVFENVRCSLLWSLGYKYNFWSLVSKSPALNEGADAILEQI